MGYLFFRTGGDDGVPFITNNKRKMAYYYSLPTPSDFLILFFEYRNSMTSLLQPHHHHAELFHAYIVELCAYVFA